MQGNNYIFVYGTLMEGCGNSHLLTEATFISKGTISGKMYHAGGFPIVTPASGSEQVCGEVYNAPDRAFRQMDALEGHPNWYKREIVDVKLTNDEVVKAWVYLQTPEQVRGRAFISSGSWRNK